MLSSQLFAFNLSLLTDADKALLLWANRHHAPALDALMQAASERLTWVPVYVLLVAGLVYWFRRRAALLLGLLVAAVGLADSITSRVFKPFFGRLRPCHEPELSARLHLPDGCGGQFGFLSSHAANSVALAVFLALVLPRGRRFRAGKILAFAWAGALCYSRVYLGAHYPSDVLGGGLVGAALGGAAAWAFRRLSARRFGPASG